MRIFVFIAYALLCFINTISANEEDIKSKNVINLAVVACGDRVPETLVLFKSALMFTQTRLNFIIITEPHLQHLFIEEFKKWPELVQSKFDYVLKEPKFPKQNGDEWRRLFKLCAAQRIFLPNILKSIDSLLYVDTDVLFISDIANVWSHFGKFNESQLAALAPEHEDPNMGWYNRFARHPYYGELGLNSGVMLMNLTRMREFNFVEKIFPLYKEYKDAIPWGDQCLLNILFHFYPERLYVYDCKWNYRPDHCMYGSNCKPAETEGVKVIHGCRRCFHDDKQPAFKAIYKVFDKYNFEATKQKKLYAKISKNFNDSKVSESYCGKAKQNFFITLKQSLKVHRNIFNFDTADHIKSPNPEL